MIKLLTVKEVAQMLKLSVSTVFKYAESGKIDSLKIGTARRFTEDQIVTFVELCKTKIGNLPVHCQ
jgi:excisionase family DNA binding protein